MKMKFYHFWKKLFLICLFVGSILHLDLKLCSQFRKSKSVNFFQSKFAILFLKHLAPFLPNKKIKNSNEDLLRKVMLFLQRLFFCARVNCQRVSYFSWRLRFLRISSLAVRLSNYEFTSHRSKMQIISRNGPNFGQMSYNWNFFK